MKNHAFLFACFYLIFKIPFQKTSWSHRKSLLLSSWYFFDEDTVHCIMPPGEGVPELISTAFTFSNPESHSNLSFLNVFTMTFDMTMIVEIVVNIAWGSNVEYAINGPSRVALGAIEGEIPATTAGGTVMYHEVASKVDMECRVCVLFHKVTALYWNMKKGRRRKKKKTDFS